MSSKNMVCLDGLKVLEDGLSFVQGLSKLVLM
jgi:hypothetical protein